MVLTFKDKELIIGATDWSYAPFRFSKILNFGSGVLPTWQDIVLSGVNSLNLLNAKADGLNYVKLFGKCEKDYTSTSMNYQTVNEMAHSTFDSSKFTVSGSPTITDGVVSNFTTGGSGNHISCATVLDGTEWLLQLKMNFGATFSNGIIATSSDGTTANKKFNLTAWQGSYNKFFSLSLGDGTNSQNFTLNPASGTDIPLNTDILLQIERKNNKYYMRMSFDNGTTFTENSTDVQYDVNTNLGYIGVSASFPFGGTIDLKYFAISKNGVPVFSGNQTGTDTYTVNGSSISIPYTISDTGFKIVDSAYLSNVQSVSENLQKTPYIVINSNNLTASDYRAKILCNNGVLKVNNQGQIYVDGTVETVKDSLDNTVTAQNLLSTGTYTDEQEILTGAVTSNCEAVYYDGTQTINTPYISTTGGLDIGAIIVHPKTTPTEQTVTAQTLTTETGNNTIQITQSGVNNLSLEVGYKAGITVTITEIEDANTDNSVTVVIS